MKRKKENKELSPKQQSEEQKKTYTVEELLKLGKEKNEMEFAEKKNNTN